MVTVGSFLPCGVICRCTGSWWNTRDRFCGFGSEYVEVAVAAQGRELVVVDAAEVDDDLVRDMTEILTAMCARLYGKRAAQNRARRALAAAAIEDAEAP
jgi:predicted site-specific integrase-resolvase